MDFDMKELARVAWRNLARHRTKTAITGAAIMISVALYIFMDGWMAGMASGSRRNIINYETGAAKLQTRLYFDKKDDLPGYESFAAHERFADALDRAGYNSAPRYVFAATAYSPASYAPVVVNAVDPPAEARMLLYPQYIESGRFIERGEFAAVLGNMTAEKLDVGIPPRVEQADFEAFVAAVSKNPDEAAFVRDCYEPLSHKKDGLTDTAADEAAYNRRLVLKRGLDKAVIGRLWAMMEASGRNDIRVSAVIDIKMAPETVSRVKWEADLLPRLPEAAKRLAEAAYSYDELGDAFLLTETDAARQDAVLEAMLRADFAGAVRHVNQLISVRVAGVINCPDPAVNSGTVYIPLDVLQDEAGMMLEGRVTELLIRDKKATPADMTLASERAPLITAALESGLAASGGDGLPPELGVFEWKRYAEDYLGYEAMEGGESMIFIVLLLFLSFLGISNTMLLAILERSKEIGMMRALGMTDGQLVLVYMMEAGFMGLLGSAAGLAIGCLVNIPMVKFGVDMTAMNEAMGASGGFRIASNFRSAWNLPVIIAAPVAATLLASLMAFFPTRRSLKPAVSESLRFE